MTTVSSPARGLTSLTAGDLATVPGAVVERLRRGRDVLCFCHENPEADALGSALAFALAIEQLGGRATPVCSDPVPEMYSFMPQIGRFRQDPEPGRDYDLIVVGDCGDLARVGPVLQRHADLFERVPIVNIDHHLSNTGFGVVDWIDAKAAATCEMGTLLMPALGVPLGGVGGAIAAALVAGLVIDTANFQHPNTTPRTLRVAAELVAAGAPLHDTARLLYRTKPNRQLQLFGRVLAGMGTDLDGRLVWATLTTADLSAAGASSADAEGLSDLLGQSDSADVVVMFKESGNETRLSVRTHEGGVDATELTALWGGGGHARAAGATVRLPLSEAVPVVLDAARTMIQRPGKRAG